MSSEGSEAMVSSKIVLIGGTKVSVNKQAFLAKYPRSNLFGFEKDRKEKEEGEGEEGLFVPMTKQQFLLFWKISMHQNPRDLLATLSDIDADQTVRYLNHFHVNIFPEFLSILDMSHSRIREAVAYVLGSVSFCLEKATTRTHADSTTTVIDPLVQYKSWLHQEGLPEFWDRSPEQLGRLELTFPSLEQIGGILYDLRSIYQPSSCSNHLFQDRLQRKRVLVDVANIVNTPGDTVDFRDACERVSSPTDTIQQMRVDARTKDIQRVLAHSSTQPMKVGVMKSLEPQPTPTPPPLPLLKKNQRRYQTTKEVMAKRIRALAAGQSSEEEEEEDVSIVSATGGERELGAAAAAGGGLHRWEEKEEDVESGDDEMDAKGGISSMASRIQSGMSRFGRAVTSFRSLATNYSAAPVGGVEERASNFLPMTVLDLESQEIPPLHLDGETAGTLMAPPPPPMDIKKRPRQHDTLEKQENHLLSVLKLQEAEYRQKAHMLSLFVESEWARDALCRHVRNRTGMILSFETRTFQCDYNATYAKHLFKWEMIPFPHQFCLCDSKGRSQTFIRHTQQQQLHHPHEHHKSTWLVGVFSIATSDNVSETVPAVATD